MQYLRADHGENEFKFGEGGHSLNWVPCTLPAKGLSRVEYARNEGTTTGELEKIHIEGSRGIDLDRPIYVVSTDAYGV